MILDRLQLRQPTTRLQISGYRFLLRRIECALLGRDLHTANEPLRAHTASLAVGCVLAALAVAGCGLWGWLRPHPDLGQARIVMGQHSGALYVRVGDTWHPVLNLVSARLIAATDANPEPVHESDLGRTKRGPLLGIPGAPQFVGEPLSADESADDLRHRAVPRGAGIARTLGVAIMPGITALQRIPREPHSAASVRAIPTIPAFDAP